MRVRRGSVDCPQLAWLQLSGSSATDTSALSGTPSSGTHRPHTAPPPARPAALTARRPLRDAPPRLCSVRHLQLHPARRRSTAVSSTVVVVFKLGQSFTAGGRVMEHRRCMAYTESGERGEGERGVSSARSGIGCQHSLCGLVGQRWPICQS